MAQERGAHDGNDGLVRLGFLEAVRVATELGRLASGSPGLDTLTGGGYEEGKITEVFGPSNSGKTQLAMQAAVMAAARGWKSVFVDTESTFRPERVSQIAAARGLEPGPVLESLFCLRAEDVSSQAKSQDRMRRDPRVADAKLVVVDTVTKNFSLEFPERQSTGRRQGALGVYLERMAVDAYMNRRVVLITNRVVSVTRDGISQDVAVGGLTLARFASRSVRLRRDGHDVVASLERPGGRGVSARCTLTERGFE